MTSKQIKVLESILIDIIENSNLIEIIQLIQTGAENNDPVNLKKDQVMILSEFLTNIENFTRKQINNL